MKEEKTTSALQQVSQLKKSKEHHVTVIAARSGGKLSQRCFKETFQGRP